MVVLFEAYVFSAFFFSSRRRHTRSLRDWSSDVCSSDLTHAARQRAAVQFGHQHVAGPRAFVEERALRWRSEERRVGKECRSRVRANHTKQKKTRHIKSSTVSNLLSTEPPPLCVRMSVHA